MVIRFAMSWLGRRIGGLLGERRPCRPCAGIAPRIMFNNDMAMLHLAGRSASVDLHSNGDEHDQHGAGRAEPAAVS